MKYECFTCNGTGEINGGPCERCEGSGEIEACFIIAADLQRTVLENQNSDLEVRVTAIEEDMSTMIDVHPWFYDSITQGIFYTVVGSNHWRNIQFYNNPGVVNDQVNYKVLMKAGTYDFRLVCTKGPAYGILKMYVDSVEEASINTYSATAIHNTINYTTGIVVATSGIKTVSLKVDGNFQMNIAAMLFQKKS